MTKLEELKLRAGIQDNPDQEGIDLFATNILDTVIEQLEQGATADTLRTTFNYPNESTY